MNVKDRADVLGKKADILYKKVVILLASAGGSWVYILKFESLVYILILTFIVASFGIYFNVLRLSDLQKELKGIKYA